MTLYEYKQELYPLQLEAYLTKDIDRKLAIYELIKGRLQECRNVYSIDLTYAMTDIIAFTAELLPTKEYELLKIFHFYNDRERTTAAVPTTFFPQYTKLSKVKHLPEELKEYRGKRVASRGYVIPTEYLAIMLKIVLS